MFTEADVEPSQPNRMQNHMKHIVSLRRRINLKMAPHLNPPPLHLHILPQRNRRKYLLQIGDISHRNNHGKRLPVQNVAERSDVTVLDQNRHAAEVEALHHSRTSHLVAARANTVAAAPHHVVVGHVFGEVSVDLHVGVRRVLPVLKEDRPDRAMDAAGIEDECRPLGRRRATD